jgi:hypothetical protein
MPAIILTPDRQPLPCELQVRQDVEAGEQGDNVGERGLRGALASIVGARLTTQVSARNLIMCAWQKNASSPPSTRAMSHATSARTSQHIPVDE